MWDAGIIEERFKELITAVPFKRTETSTVNKYIRLSHR